MARRSYLTAFKIQNSVSLEGMHNRRKDWSAFGQMKTETELTQQFALAFYEAMHLYWSAKLLIHRCPTFTN